jgi:hypothetical protein
VRYFCFDYSQLVSRKEKWRIVGAFFVGSVPRIAEGSTICGTNVTLRERPAGYFVLRCDRQDLTLEDILSNGFATVRQTLRRMFSAMAAERAKKRRKLVLRPGYEQLTSIRLQRMPSLLGQDTAGAGQNMETRLAETTSMFFGQSYGWPLAPLGTCEVIRFRTNSPIRFLTAPSPMPAKPLKTTCEAPRSEEG